MVVYGGVWWCMVVYGGVWWCMVVYGGVWWCKVVYTDVYCEGLRCIVVYCGAWWRIVAAAAEAAANGVRWCMVAHAWCGVRQRQLKHTNITEFQ
jgi:hypothetical protein